MKWLIDMLDRLIIRYGYFKVAAYLCAAWLIIVFVFMFLTR